MKNDHCFILCSLTHGAPGVLGGKFLARGRVKKPGQELFKSQPSEYVIAQDLYVGATLCLNNVQFQLLDADEYTFKYMEQHAEEVGRKLNEKYLFRVVYVRFCIEGFGIASMFSIVVFGEGGLELTWLHSLVQRLRRQTIHC